MELTRLADERMLRRVELPEPHCIRAVRTGSVVAMVRIIPVVAVLRPHDPVESDAQQRDGDPEERELHPRSEIARQEAAGGRGERGSDQEP